MSSEKGMIEFTKDNIDIYLKDVAKEYRRLVGKGMPAEIVIIGGASVLINYGFREMTTDIDAIINAASAMKDVINKIGDKHGLPNGWLNADFKKTDSFSSKLLLFSEYYRTYSNVLTVRTVSAEYLIAMKLKSGRRYKHDISDVMGVLKEQKNAGKPISLEQIKDAVSDLYGKWEELPGRSREIIEKAFLNENFGELYGEYSAQEEDNRKRLIRFQRDNPGVLTKENVDDIIDGFEEKPSILERLKMRQKEIDERERNREKGVKNARKNDISIE